MFKFGTQVVESSSDQRILARQWQELQANRAGATNNNGHNVMYDLGVESGIIAPNALATNANLKIGEMYRDLDGTALMSPKATGNQATLQRLLSKARPVHIGKKIVEHRRVSEAGTTGMSMSGQTGIVIDHTTSNYQSGIVPIFDAGFGRDWRDVEGQRSEMFDALAEDAVEIEHNVLERVNTFLWDGNAEIEVKGVTWGGLRADASIATRTPGVNWSATATAAQDIVNDILTSVDVLRITNRCTDVLTLAISPQTMTNWLRPTSTNDATFGNILEFVKRTLAGRIGEIYEDANLASNQSFMYVDSRRGLHAMTGMAMSSYALKRDMHNSPYNFVKWMAAGFMAKRTFSGLRCALYIA